MVILIAGPSHSGKTVLAQKLLEYYHYPYLSIDHLKMGLIRSGNTELTVEDDEGLTLYLWPVVREIIKTAIENSQNLIVEGCYIPFDWRKDFSGDYLKNIRFICLCLSDSYVDAHLDDIKKHACDIEKRLNDDYYTAESLKSDNRKAAEGYRKAGESVLLIEHDYGKTVNDLLQDIINTSNTIE